jgi:sulfite exporter TauE/SafE/copper chaperone CopZ
MAERRGSKRIYIEGMHCAACVRLVGDELRALPGVKGVKVSLSRGTAELAWSGTEPSTGELDHKLKERGYGAADSPVAEPKARTPLARSALEWLAAAAAAGAVVLVFNLVQGAGLIRLTQGGNAAASWGISLLIGLVASLSSCLAVVGSLVIAFGEMYEARGSFARAVLAPNLLFQAGRVAGFAMLGGLLGLVGGELHFTGRFVSIVMFVTVVMLLLGLHILGILPSPSKLGLRLPLFLTAGMGRLRSSRRPWAPAGLGALTFFLPCGFTQSMQVMALASGGFPAGAAIMGLFALGTLPVLLLVGSGAAWSRGSKAPVFRRAAGLLVLVFALFTFSSGSELFAEKGVISGGHAPAAPAAPVSAPPAEAQTVEMRIRYEGFVPSVLSIKKGAPVTWIIWGDQVTGCTNRIIVPSLKINQRIQPGKNVVSFTAPDEPGRIGFSCWMGMVRGSFELR